MKQDYDVIIIGGGLLGCATADTGAYQTGFDGNGAGNV